MNVYCRKSNFFFLPQITLSEDTIQDMVQASDLLLMTDLKLLCCQFLESCITAENCIGIRLFSLHYCLHHVYYTATEFLQTHFRDVVLSEEFRELPPERLKELLAMEKLNVGNEKHVLEAAVRWLGHDPEVRKVRVQARPRVRKRTKMQAYVNVLCLCLKVHMKEVMSSVWMQGLDANYLREQVPHTRKKKDVLVNRSRSTAAKFKFFLEILCLDLSATQTDQRRQQWTNSQ